MFVMHNCLHEIAETLAARAKEAGRSISRRNPIIMTSFMQLVEHGTLNNLFHGMLYLTGYLEDEMDWDLLSTCT